MRNGINTRSHRSAYQTPTEQTHNGWSGLNTNIQIKHPIQILAQKKYKPLPSPPTTDRMKRDFVTKVAKIIFKYKYKNKYDIIY